MKKTIYSKRINELITHIDDYLNGVTDVEFYQMAVVKTEVEIVLLEEGELRMLLSNHENAIELIRFTTEDVLSIHAEVQRFRDELRSWV
jgi:hypothetical protein